MWIYIQGSYPYISDKTRMIRKCVNEARQFADDSEQRVVKGLTLP